MPLPRPQLDTDGWPEWMWLLTENDIKEKPIGLWHRFHFGRENKRFTDLLNQEMANQIVKQRTNGPAQWAKCWNRAVAQAGYDVPKGWL